MSYTPTVWQEKITPLGPTNMNKLEAGVAAAQNSMVGDLVFVSDEGALGSGDLIFKTGANERLRIANSGAITAPDHFANATGGDFLHFTASMFNPPTVGSQQSILQLIGSARGNAGSTGTGMRGLSVLMQDNATVNKTISGAVNNGSGKIRVTCTGHTFFTGDKIVVYGVTGTTEANGAWVITVIDANTFDLNGSTFTHAYVSGGTATNRSYQNGIFVGVAPVLDRGVGMSGGFANSDDLSAVAVQNGGTGKASEAFYVAAGTAGWAAGLGIDGLVDNGIQIHGTCNNYGIDFVGGTYGIAAIRLPNNVPIFGRNASNTADVSLLNIDTSGYLNLAPSGELTTFGGSIQLADNTVIASSTTNGIKIANATNQKLAFFGATPVVQPSAVGTATGYSAGSTAVTFHSDDKYTGNVGSTGYTINGIVAALKNLGLIAS